MSGAFLQRSEALEYWVVQTEKKRCKERSMPTEAIVKSHQNKTSQKLVKILRLANVVLMLGQRRRWWDNLGSMSHVGCAPAAGHQ